MKTYQTLCIDDDQQFLDSLESTLPSKVEALCEDFRCAFDFVATPAEAFEVMASAPDRDMHPAMVVSDQVMPGVSGIELIEKIKAAYPDVVCVLLTGYAGLESAKYAINRRLLDQYVSKPIEDIQGFASLLANLLRGHHLRLEERQRTSQLARTVEELRAANENVRAMQSAAEQIALLSKNLKVLDFDEVVNMVTSEIPRLFGAEWSVMCLPKNGCPAAAGHRVKCPCPDASLVDRQDAAEVLRRGFVHCGEPPVACMAMGSQAPDVIVPLSIAAVPEREGPARKAEEAYLCMCRIAPALSDGVDLIKYKAGLVQEILSANLTNARLCQEARRQGQTDSLTGVRSRRALVDGIEAEHQRSLRYGRPFCIAILDVDNCKRANDKHGHDAGDSALKQLAQVLLSQVRASDMLARYGGDGFAVLMPETQLEDGLAAAERFRNCARTVLLPDGDPLTVSVGVAEWSLTGTEDAVNVLRRADAALYQAKSQGQDRTQVAAQR